MKQEDYQGVVLDLLILTFARQEALVHLVIDKLVDKGEDEDSIVRAFDEDFLATEQRLRDLIYANAGQIDLRGLFGPTNDEKE